MSLWKPSQPNAARDQSGYKANKGRQGGTNRKNSLVTKVQTGGREAREKAAQELVDEFGMKDARQAIRDTSGLSGTRKESLINRLRGS